MVVQKKDTKKIHITQEERVKISVWLGEEKSHRRIGIKLARDHTVISREIKRNSVWCAKTRGTIYKPIEAERLRLERKSKANRGHIILLNDPVFCVQIETLLKEKLGEGNEGERWGLDELLGRLSLKGFRSINTSTVYRFIDEYKKDRKKYLRFGKHGYKKRGSKKKKTALVGVPLIEERPTCIEERQEIGHWEADMVVGPVGEKGGLVTLIERKTRYTLISKIPRSTKTYAYAAMYTMLHKEKVVTTTSDNGSEFASLALLGRKLGIDVYRCHPYASREKGSNERNNGFIRWFCKKGLSIQQYDDEYIAMVQNKLNHKPRKILGYKTPYEVYHGVDMKYL